MPKLPVVKSRRGGHPTVPSVERAVRVARYLNHASQSGAKDGYAFAGATRSWLDEFPLLKTAFIAWYEAQP